ncbi:unnamed protein product [Hymenolepis diminuta]|uniref:SH3 domain-containing protein n=1 Tax=Hymenolepis diminuta TaxID=6216 RepID=A0A0R3SL20_HYMDI|nr:unnamed protein product [Hymenolepis diminuta]
MGTVKEADIVIAKFDYKATDSQELDIQKGEKLTLMDDTQHWWKVMNSFGNVGYVPSNYVKRSKQGLFSSLRNTLGRRKSRTDLPMPATGTSTGGRPPASTQSSTRNGNGNTGSKAGVKASVESLDYVAPSLPSSGSGQSPTRGTAASIGYQPVSSAFPTNGTTTILDNSRSCSALPPSSHQLPPVSYLLNALNSFFLCLSYRKLFFSISTDGSCTFSLSCLSDFSWFVRTFIFLRVGCFINV